MRVDTLENGKVVKSSLAKLIRKHKYLSDVASWYIGTLGEELQKLQAKNKGLKERIELAVDYLPDSPDKAMAFLKPALKKGGK